MKITWFGHSAYRLETGNSVIMIDPFLSGSPVFEGTVADAAKGATHVALTHGHDDHIGDTVEICTSTGAKLVAIFEICMYLSGKGVQEVDPTNTGGTVHADDFSITFVRADHSSAAMTDDGPVYLGNPCGLIITPKDGPTVYHMGDTDVFGDMALINELHAPKVAMVPIGDRFTMGADRAALACRRFFDFETILPCHYGTFPIIDPDANAFVTAMGDQVSRVRVIGVGDSIDV